ncbi:uncharacterized protein LOC110613258 [Manihot esculenta]|uniref:uncharacterized protein LOC110613258 n=1 Tax=Manihot esculenta TaxID=3983 RepID=UPI000B5D2B3D|nr:uncharacterized protein LOC110613258 [Manihot esculenta]
MCNLSRAWSLPFLVAAVAAIIKAVIITYPIHLSQSQIFTIAAHEHGLYLSLSPYNFITASKEQIVLDTTRSICFFQYLNIFGLKEMSSRTSVKRQHEESSPPSVKESDRVRDDTYKISIKPVSDKEVNYLYIPISYYILNPIEKRHEGLKPYDIANYYTEHHSAIPFIPKAFDYYKVILAETGSVEIAPTERTGHQWAYSKFIIKNIITSEEWGDSLFKQRELRYGKPIWYSYFDYIQAWTGALLYENRQRKFSWFIQFQLEKEIKEFPP